LFILFFRNIIKAVQKVACQLSASREGKIESFRSDVF